MTENEPPERRVRSKHYPISFRQEAVRLVEAGEAQGVVTERLSTSRPTLRTWLLRYGTACYQQMRREVFTAAQKPQIVSELRLHSNCDFPTPTQAHEREGPLVRRWKNYYQPVPPGLTNGLHPVPRPCKVQSGLSTPAVKPQPDYRLTL